MVAGANGGPPDGGFGSKASSPDTQQSQLNTFESFCGYGKMHFSKSGTSGCGFDAHKDAYNSSNT